jgi:cytochrome c oxidase subunit 3
MSEAAVAIGAGPSDETGGGLDRGRVGMIGLLLSEAAFFATFLTTYLFYVGKSPSGPYPDQVLEPPILGTLCLLSSSLSVGLAVRALRRGSTRGFLRWWGITIGLGAAFLISTALEWHDLIYRHGLTISTNLFGTTFYSLVGLHAAHVSVGLVLLTLVFVLSGWGGHVSRSHVERVDLLSWYWHFVDAVWVFVFTAVYIVGR